MVSHLDDGYRIMEPRQFIDLLGFFDRDTNIQAAFQILKQSLLSGGVWINYSPSDVDSTSSVATQQELQTNNLLWGKWCCDILRSLLATGIAGSSVKTEEEDGLVPFVLPLDQIEVRMLRDGQGNSIFKYYEYGQFGHPEQTEILNVVTFVYKDPDVNFRLCSVVSTLLPDYSLEMHMLQSTLTAEHYRCQPFLVTETVQAKHDPNAMVLARLGDDPMLGDGKHPHPDTTCNPSIARFESERRYNVTRYLNSDKALIDTVMRNSTTPSQFNGPTPKEINLKPLQTLARHTLPEAPANLLPFRVERQARVFLAFGVPLSMSHSNTQKSNTASSTMGGGSKDSSAREVFLNAQNAWKCLLENYILKMHRFMHHNTRLLQVLHKHKEKKEVLSPGKLKKMITPSVKIASLPEDNVAEGLYSLGMLKYEAMVRMYRQKYGLDINDFNDEPVLPKMSFENELAERQLKQQKQIETAKLNQAVELAAAKQPPTKKRKK